MASYGWRMVKCHLMVGEWLSGILWLGMVNVAGEVSVILWLANG